MISAYLVLAIYAMSIDLFSIIYLYLQQKLLLSVLILLWTIVNIVFLPDRERRRQWQAARQLHSKIASRDHLSNCMYLSLVQMYIQVWICLFHMGFNLCQTCSFPYKLVLFFSKISCHFTMAIWQEPHAFKLHCGLFVQFLELQYAISYEVHKRKWSTWGQALLSGPWILFQFEALQDSHSGLFTLFLGSCL